ncbi:uncharacterized protein E5676_scaffold708G00150 [Cucumis melo var. makuwa]|uniref:Reverse transcriptase/retrotransposon-derived protein RNase H-like domain-containing protein n=1 Tax=Cucumis melo var. makuwa TaxID=1194695 RepID=A0A5A7TDC8_CUCMM|nr:uncharacterized protein E6C27_scaffold125G001700 [Cucumis melo var. makuwa]TYK20290.1 uncharacterized protein E5676_scaffold708G00150 [Cucumis melo var. makuwa]
MVDATTGHEALSFMDESSEYNQIRMALSDEEMTAFRTLKGIYCYKVIPFGLKNVGATYQRAMQKVFDDMQHNLRKYQLRTNPFKCAFGMTSGKFLSFIEMSLGALLAQEEEKGKERALYYLSRTLVGAEVNYSPIKKMCLALFFAIDKLRHYMQAFTVHLVAKTDHKAIKRQALADFLVDHPIPSDWKLCKDLPDDEVFFMEVMEPWTNFGLAELCSNNVAEYQALIIGLQMYDVKPEDLKPYFTYARQLMERFDSVMLEHFSRIENKKADALANLATALTMPDDVRRRVADFIYYKETLYRRSLKGHFLRCLGKEQSIKALKETYAGVCGAHQSGPKLQFQLRRISYYWPKMVQDSMDYAKKCEACQYHANFIHQPLEPLHPTVASWPFEAWGLNLVDPITPKLSAGHSYILATTDYFLKAISLRETKKENMTNFIRTHIIYRYDIPPGL